MTEAKANRNQQPIIKRIKYIINDKLSVFFFFQYLRKRKIIVQKENFNRKLVLFEIIYKKRSII